ncbi:hypothetical protein [Amycolatopsis albispora]|uniref:Uncharacterized protein n=1 Tax=Amycolatopsis albispora TaxID=1804986 RepID=A0A344L136_9PSEU|nr:hypothetical protein [Amycolatopsis albispora]AXB41760.1 hypothetical protein A4R43_03840 [Amycolatopsis albispora]
MDDPHIHVDRRVLHTGADQRNLIASMLGAVSDAPAVVTTGCGIEVRYAMTSPHPESVTCLACREHAHREHLAFAGQVENLSRMPGSVVTPAQAAQVAERHHDLARRFSGGSRSG